MIGRRLFKIEDEAETTFNDLMEWDYGIFERRRNADLRDEIPSWSVWVDPIVGGADRVPPEPRHPDRQLDLPLEKT